MAPPIAPCRACHGMSESDLVPDFLPRRPSHTKQSPMRRQGRSWRRGAGFVIALLAFCASTFARSKCRARPAVDLRIARSGERRMRSGRRRMHVRALALGLLLVLIASPAAAENARELLMNA